MEAFADTFVDPGRLEEVKAANEKTAEESKYLRSISHPLKSGLTEFPGRFDQGGNFKEVQSVQPFLPIVFL